MVALRTAARSQAPASVRGRSLTRYVAFVVFSGLVHVATIGAALGVWSASRSSATPTLGVVFVDLAPATPAAATEARLMDGPASDDPTVAALNRQVAQLSAENTELSSSLLDERQRTAQLEADYRRELSASETARSRLGDELAAVVADHEALASELTTARERAAALEQELAAREQAERAALDEVKATYERLVSSLQGEIAARDVALEQANSRVTVAIADRVLFPSGQATLTPAGERVIDKVGTALTGVTDRRVLIEGHTDNVPIGPDLMSRFPTNWELSTARATEVVKRLIEHARLPPDRLQPAGRADTDPVTSNDTEDGRRRNRRIEIILLPPASTPDSRAGS
jgi:chemotaxis protein MotB